MFFLTTIAAHTLVVDDEIEKAITHVIKKLSTAMGMSKYHIPIYLLHTEEANAAAISTGAMILNTGLIAECLTPEEFIGVIAHEMGHIKQMHMVRFTDTTGYSAVIGGSLGLGLILASATGGASLIVSLLGIHFANTEFLSQMRVDEFEADQIAVNGLKKIHWPASGLETFFKRLMEKDFLIGTVGWSTHPLSRERLERVQYLTKKSKGTLESSVIQSYQRIRAKVLGYTRQNTQAKNTYERAMAFYAKREFKSALENVNILLQNEPHDIYYQELKADILFFQGKIQKAQTLYGEIIQHDKTLKYVPIKWVSCAIILKNELDKAIALLNTERIKNPQTAYIWHLMGHIYYIKKDEPTMWFCRCQAAFLNGDKEFIKKHIKQAESTLIFKNLCDDLKTNLKLEP